MLKRVWLLLPFLLVICNLSFSQSRDDDSDDDEQPKTHRTHKQKEDADDEDDKAQKKHPSKKTPKTDDEATDEDAADNSVTPPDEQGDVVIVGPISHMKLAAIKDFDFVESKANYTADEESENYLKDNLKYYHLVVFLGTWDADCQELMPQLLRVLHDIDFPVKGLKMYGLDKFKKGRGSEAEDNSITEVPTIIVMDHDSEIGRIEGMPKAAVEQDIVDIIRSYSEHSQSGIGGN